MPGEEEIVGAAFAELQRQFPRAFWILAPRHPERFDAVTEWVLRRGWRLLRRSEIAPSSAADLDWPEVFLVDSMGELAGLYRLATVAYVGGSLVARGGHNPLEPALFARPIVFGPSMENFREMAQALVQENAAIVVNDAKELEKVLGELSADEAKRQRMGQAGRAFVERHRGATHHAIGAIQEILAARPGAPTLPVARQTLNHRGSGQSGVRS
jgi:3-deoxy-D-manno-octulosonic-acid transferase